MVAMRMVQMTIDEVIDVIAMRDGFVPASRPMHVPRCMAGTLMLRRAHIRVLRRNLDGVLIHVARVHVVQMTVMKIVHISSVPTLIDSDEING